MNTSMLLLVLAIMLLAAKPSLVNMMPVQPDSSNTTDISTTPTPNPGQHFSLSRYTAMVHQLVGAVQTIWFLLTQHGTLGPFEYCFIQSIANPPSTNLTIKDRLLMDYQVLNELTTPLRDVVNYEGQIGNDTDIYQKLAWAQEQLNASVEEIQNTQNSDQLMEQLSHMGLPSEVHHHNPEFSTSSNSTSNNTMSQDRCADVITNSTDEFRDLFEIYLGLNFAVWDLLDIQHDLDPHYPHENTS